MIRVTYFVITIPAWRCAFLLQMRPSVQELLCMPYVSQHIQKYAEHIVQAPDDTGLNLDQLPIIKQIRRYHATPSNSRRLSMHATVSAA